MNPEYARRIDRVIDYLRENLNRPVKLAELAAVACFSEFHFHRIFRAVGGETVNSITNRLRLEKAARLLRYSRQSLTGIALECGFSAPATFSRAFRAGYDTSPSEFRKSGGEIKNSKIRKELFDAQEYLLSMSAEEKRAAFPVRLIDLRRVATAWDHLIRGWLINSDFEPEHAPGLDIFLDKDRATDWSHFELDLCFPVRKLT